MIFTYGTLNKPRQISGIKNAILNNSPQLVLGAICHGSSKKAYVFFFLASEKSSQFTQRTHHLCRKVPRAHGMIRCLSNQKYLEDCSRQPLAGISEEITQKFVKIKSFPIQVINQK